MGEKLLLLVIGFALTTVAGGLLGYFLQRRSWRLQDDARRHEDEREAAREFFEEISRLFDKRLFRMRQLDDALSEEAPNAEDVERLLNRYREAVNEWNENINRMLALAQRYFGKNLRDGLDYGLMSKFVTAGSMVNARLHAYRKGGADLPPSLDREVAELRQAVYAFNVDLIEQIQDGKVGVFHPDVTTSVQRLSD